MENESVVLPDGVGREEIEVADPHAVPRVDEAAVTGLKFSVALPRELAVRTLGERLADPNGAEATARGTIVELRG